MENTKKIWIWATIATLLVIVAVYISMRNKQVVVEADLPIVTEEEVIVATPVDSSAQTQVQGSADPLPDEVGAQSGDAAFESSIVEDGQQMDGQATETPTAN